MHPGPTATSACHWQTPPLHARPEGHAVPQLPQLFGSTAVFVQTPEQPISRFVPASGQLWQVPLTQIPLAHSPSLRHCTQVPAELQSGVAGNGHAPASVAPVWQAQSAFELHWAHCPVAVLQTEGPPSARRQLAALHPLADVEHTPAVQVSPGPQIEPASVLLQPPQLRRSWVVSEQAPAQRCSVPGQAHAPWMHCVPSVQTVPASAARHPPQFRESLEISEQIAPQTISSDAQIQPPSIARVQGDSE